MGRGPHYAPYPSKGAINFFFFFWSKFSVIISIYNTSDEILQGIQTKKSNSWKVKTYWMHSEEHPVRWCPISHCSNNLQITCYFKNHYHSPKDWEKLKSCDPRCCKVCQTKWYWIHYATYQKHQNMSGYLIGIFKCCKIQIFIS